MALPAAGVGVGSFYVADYVFGLERFWCFATGLNVGSAALLGEALFLIRLAAPRFYDFELPAAR